MSLVHVAVAAIVNDQHEVLIALRPENTHQGGFWEFPGGKVEAGEQVVEALQREISEELGIDVLSSRPLIQIRHDYPDKSVLLDVHRVDSFAGQPKGMEGQPLRWQSVDKLDESEFPAANRGIIRALTMPEHYVITGSFDGEQDFISRLDAVLNAGEQLIQLRLKSGLDTELRQNLQEQAFSICQSVGARLLVNTTIETFNPEHAHGLHLSSRELMQSQQRPVSREVLLSASCHNATELERAMKLDADILLLSPVRETQSHPGIPGMGWAEFGQLVQDVDRPVYALGGMTGSDVDTAIRYGGQGVAAISAFWNHE
jgi:8-oxo-dGTP diphosphatase